MYLVTIIRSPSREGRDGTSHRQGRSLLRGWMGSTYWRTLRREMFGCLYSKHTSVIHYLAFNRRQCFLMRMRNRVCKNVSTYLVAIIRLFKLESFQGRKRWHLSHAVRRSTYWRTLRREMFGCVYSKHTLVIHYLAFNTRQCFLMRMRNIV